MHVNSQIINSKSIGRGDFCIEVPNSWEGRMQALPWVTYGKDLGQVENAEVRKRKYGNGSTETEVRKWEEKPPLGV